MSGYGKVPDAAKKAECNDCGRKFLYYACAMSFVSCPSCDSEDCSRR